MGRVAKFTGLPMAALMLVGPPVVFSRPPLITRVPPRGGAGRRGGSGGASGAPAAGGAAVLGAFCATAAAMKPTGSNAKAEISRFTVQHPDPAHAQDLAAAAARAWAQTWIAAPGWSGCRRWQNDPPDSSHRSS